MTVTYLREQKIPLLKKTQDLIVLDRIVKECKAIADTKYAAPVFGASDVINTDKSEFARLCPQFLALS
ncbi:hypothetical protein AU509_14905 [Lonsdalea britannica]|nr:hypothetical protein AU509_14905 [Lonsdalea britannica]